MENKYYKLREDVKPYFDKQFHDRVEKIEFWNKEVGTTILCLEKTIPKIELYVTEVVTGHGTSSAGLFKGSWDGEWTKEEIDQIKQFMNMGGFTGMAKIWCENQNQLKFNTNDFYECFEIVR